MELQRVGNDWATKHTHTYVYYTYIYRYIYTWAVYVYVFVHSCCLVAKSLLILPINCSIQSFPVLHYLPEFAWTHVHWVGDAIQPSHSLSFPSPSAFNLSQLSGSFSISQYFASGGQSIGVSVSASGLPMNIQDWFPLGWTGLILQSKELSRVFSNTTIEKHQFFGTQLSL